MAPSEALTTQMPQLRSQASRLRQEAAVFRDRMEQAKAQLQPRADQARAEREEATRQLRRDLQEGAVEAADRALLARVVGGETTWHDVMSGADAHPAATDYRARFTARFRDALERLVEADEDLSRDVREVRQASEATRWRT